MTIVGPTRAVTGGVDTHLDAHVAAVLDLPSAGCWACKVLPTTPAGYRQLMAWMTSHSVRCAGSEWKAPAPTGPAWPATCANTASRWSKWTSQNRQARRSHGKSDPADAIEAARAAQSGRASGVAKSERRQSGSHPGAHGRSPLGPRHPDRNPQPDPPAILHRPRPAAGRPGRAHPGLLGHRRAAGLRPGTPADPVTFATKTALRRLARRASGLGARKRAPGRPVGQLVPKSAPQLLALYGVGVHTAAPLLVGAGDNPQRLRSEAAWRTCAGWPPSKRPRGRSSAAGWTGRQPPGQPRPVGHRHNPHGR